MAENTNYFGKLLEIFNKLSMQQRLLIGGIVVVSIVLFVFIIFVFNEPSYSTLYSDLAPEEAQKVVEALNERQVPYKLEDEGQTIKVPKDRLHETRLQLAGEGLPSSGVVGYEVFDEQSMGMSEFKQKLNYKRAIEGELTKTILQQDGVDAARVHIVIPERAVFKDEQKDPTASVVLKLVEGYKVTERNIVAIANLVASSVEGLEPDNVTIVDSKGKLLTREKDEDPLGEFTARQYELKSTVEKYLADKAQSVLDDVLGYGNSIVKVNVELDFDQVEKTMEIFDPESQIEVSEQIITSNQAGTTYGDTSLAETENTTTNYEISKTIQKVIEGTGNIQRLTVATVVNEPTTVIQDGDETQRISEPRTQEDLNKIEQIVRQSIGVDGNRNDIVSVVSMPFETQLLIKETEQPPPPKTFMEEWGNTIIMVLAILAALFILKNLLNRIKEEKILIGPRQQAEGIEGGLDRFELEGPKVEGLETGPTEEERQELIEVGDIKKEITDDAIRRRVRQEKITNYVSKNPVEAARLINLWLREDEMD